MGQFAHCDWNKERARSLAIEATQLCGLDSPGMRLAHFGSNATFYLPQGHVALRIADPTRSEQSVRTEVELAYQLSQAGVPIVRPCGSVPEPVRVGHTFATVWEWIDHVQGAPIPPAVMGKLLHHFHKAGRNLRAPRFDPAQAVYDRLNLLRHDGEQSDDLVFLQEYLDQSIKDAEDVFIDDRCVIHADWTSWNILDRGKEVPDDERYVIADLEESGRGPLAWDFVPLLQEVVRFGRPPEEFEELCCSYGAGDELIRQANLLRPIREVSNVSWAMKVRDQSPAHQQEAMKRLTALRELGNELWEHSHPIGSNLEQ